ncbi:HNH endonuclease [Nocardia cyriacigeorgica]|uniref:HNH endonuclease n=2 Tax=Nocardia cyriacigeorgica TaxID=135487 RepID=A0ABX0CXW0_9NOCA|nr:HNH endonuclease [Nocardia cyriacigeorgica]
MTLSGRHRDGWTLDHVKPRRTHPELALAPTNVKPAHNRCNSAKHASVYLDMQKVRVSRQW